MRAVDPELNKKTGFKMPAPAAFAGIEDGSFEVRFVRPVRVAKAPIATAKGRF